jgi:hypothetical protein
MLPKNKVPSQYDTISYNNGTRQFTFNIGAGSSTDGVIFNATTQHNNEVFFQTLFSAAAVHSYVFPLSRKGRVKVRNVPVSRTELHLAEHHRQILL